MGDVTEISLRAERIGERVPVRTGKLREACRLSDDWGGWRILRDADAQIAALVEVGAIPYRERYEGRMIG